MITANTLPKTSLSLEYNNLRKVGKHVLTTLNGGGGFLFRHKFDIVQTILRTALILRSDSSNFNNIGKAPNSKTRSLGLGPSPAMLPNAQVACSATCSCGEFNKAINLGRAPDCMITAVSSEFPDAIFVKAQQASN